MSKIFKDDNIRDVLLAVLVVFCAATLAQNFLSNNNSNYILKSSAVDAGVAEIEDGIFRWKPPAIHEIEIEKQVIIKVPQIKYIEVEKPVVLWQDVHKAMVEYNHEQSLRQLMIDEAMIDSIELETGKSIDEAIKEPANKIENKKGFLSRFLRRKKKQE